MGYNSDDGGITRDPIMMDGWLKMSDDVFVVAKCRGFYVPRSSQVNYLPLLLSGILELMERLWNEEKKERS